MIRLTGRALTSLAKVGVIALSLFLMVTMWKSSPVPELSALSIASGVVSHINAGKYSVTFGLEGEELTFSYPSKSFDLDQVFEAASRADAIVEVLYLSRDRSMNQIAWALHSDGRVVQAYSETVANWSQDDLVGKFLAAFFAASVFLFVYCWYVLPLRKAIRDD